MERSIRTAWLWTPQSRNHHRDSLDGMGNSPHRSSLEPVPRPGASLAEGTIIQSPAWCKLINDNLGISDILGDSQPQVFALSALLAVQADWPVMRRDHPARWSKRQNSSIEKAGLFGKSGLLFHKLLSFLGPLSSRSGV